MHESVTRLLRLEPDTAETRTAPHTPVSVCTDIVLAPRVLESIGKKAKYLWEDEGVSVEEYVARHYREKGVEARVVQNEPWLALRDFLFLSLTHAKENYEGGHCRYLSLLFPQNYNRGGGYVYDANPVDPNDAEKVRHAFDITPGGLLRLKPLRMVVSRVEGIRNLGLQHALEIGFAGFRQRAQMDFQIELASGDMLEKLRWLISVIPHDAILAILVRTICGDRSVDAGFPDVIACQDGDVQFVEVKGPGDSLRQSQKQFHAFAGEKLGLQVVICDVRDSSEGGPGYQQTAEEHRAEQSKQRAHKKAIKGRIGELLGVREKEISGNLRLQSIPADLGPADCVRLAELFEELGHWWNAQYVLSRGVGLASGADQLEMRTRLGEFWAKQGVRHKALHELLLVLASDRSHERACKCLRQVYEQNGVPHEANRALQLTPRELVELANRVAFHEYWSDLCVESP